MELKHVLMFSLLLLCREISGNHPLEDRLRTWETISGDDLTIHRQRRSVAGKYSTIDKEVSFKAFQRQFTLSLITSPGIFAPSFRASARGRNGVTEIKLDRSSMYQGTVLGEPGSVVHAHLQGKDLMASIKTKEDTYVVEPSWRHLPDDVAVSNKKAKMIVYRQSDLNVTRLRNRQNKNFCQISEIMDDIRQKEKKLKESKGSFSHREFAKKKDRQADVLHRRKRSTGKLKKICKLNLVADYYFYKEMGNGNTLQTMYYLINLIERVNHIFKTTSWGSEENSDVYSGYGFQISDILVHEIPAGPSYNAVNESAKGLLELFSEQDHKNCCLAHLFTYVDFPKGVLGLAYVGASKKDAFGGICTKAYDQGSLKPTLYLNTGLTTAKNWGQRILTLEADLVTTHELGHNFGAEHDNGEVKKCSPGESNHGNYIMYPAAVSGNDPNNNMFSICSKHNVLPVLKFKAPECFYEAKEFFCGNFKVEGEEECDAGYLQDDKCCDGNCKLREGMNCSSKNSECCIDCQVAVENTLCYAEIQDLCLTNTYCDGKKMDCPSHVHKPDNTSCGDKGKCKEGKCMPFCYTVGMKPCLCQGEKSNLCKRCCAPKGVMGDDMIAKCKPYTFTNGSVPELRNSARCSLGYCKDGECIKTTQDVIERVWSIFEHIAPDKIGEFLADNIVGAVLVFSLLFWVPCGCLINFVDKRREEQRRKDDEWFAEQVSGDMYRFTSNPNGGGMFGSSNALHKSQRTANVATKAGLGAKEQWNAAKERGLATRKSQEKLEGFNEQPASNDDYSARGDGAVRVGGACANQNLQPSAENDTGFGDVASVATRRISRPQLTRQNHCTADETAA